MHTHFDARFALACSRFCAANQADQAYYRRHGHLRELLPMGGCDACKRDAQRAEEARRLASA